MSWARSSQRSTSHRRSVLAAAGSAGFNALSGCGAAGRVLDGSGAGTLTIEYVEVAGARSSETFQPVVDESNAESDETVELAYDFDADTGRRLRAEPVPRVQGGAAE